VGALLDEVRRAQARIGRRRGRTAQLSDTDAAAVRFIAEAGRTTAVTTGMIVSALHLAAASGTALVDRLVARGMVVVTDHPRDRRKRIIRLIDDDADLDDLDPVTTALRAVAERLSPADAHVVGVFLGDVLDVLDHTTRPSVSVNAI
jgi:DNA-binding MarR family transcriptional regulator